ncbi:MAG: DUF4476 domain-containing protein [Bacteroidia bacterium]
MRALSIFIFISFSAFYSSAQLAELHLSLGDSAFFVSTVRTTEYSKPSSVLVITEIKPGNCNINLRKLKTVGNSTIEQPVFKGDLFLQEGLISHYVINYANQPILVKTEQFESESNNRDQVQGGIPLRTQPTTNFMGMSNDKFTEQMQLLGNIDQERQRYVTARDLLSLGTLKSSQIAEMMLLFENESNRVRLADEGQQFATDPENYQVVFEALSRPSAVRRLSRRLSN